MFGPALRLAASFLFFLLFSFWLPFAKGAYSPVLTAPMQIFIRFNGPYIAFFL